MTVNPFLSSTEADLSCLPERTLRPDELTPQVASFDNHTSAWSLERMKAAQVYCQDAELDLERVGGELLQERKRLLLEIEREGGQDVPVAPSQEDQRCAAMEVAAWEVASSSPAAYVGDYAEALSKLLIVLLLVFFGPSVRSPGAFTHSKFSGRLG